MQLKDYIPNVNKKYSEVFFSGISFESSKVKKNDIFFAIKGKKNDGNKFVEQAIQKKVSITVVNKIQKKLPINKQASSINPLGLLTETALSLIHI